MRHPYEKFIIAELATIGLAIILAIIAFIQGLLILIVLSLYLIAVSLVCDGLIALNTFKQTHATKQFVRAVAVFLLATFFMIYL
ncbi:hypothetical protein GMD78_14635 [Ornithinibacillus sp. L9]|uniref:Uncharacterized protein n=1 Tax=Ornithinibacillus caprae TaxID=2678566 RepID=A0A6N8FIV9_9BACI|nr:hypothetical protein [Ornithinibacillus caprae]MUK89602.1 hypothetical protein [Ornithinibacillus caprae]